MGQQGAPKVGEDVTALMGGGGGVGEDVTALMQEQPEDWRSRVRRKIEHPQIAEVAAGRLEKTVAPMRHTREVFSNPNATKEERIASLDNDPLLRGARSGMTLPIGGQTSGVGELVRRGGEAVERRAVPFIRSAVKPVLTEMRRRAGIEGTVPNIVANRIAKFIDLKQLRTPEQADALVKGLGGQVDDVVAKAEQANPELAIDSAERIPRYIGDLLKRVEKQILPGKDRAAIQNVGRELVEDSPLSRSTYQAPAAETLEEGLARGARTGATMAENAGRRTPSPGGQAQFTDSGGAFPQSSRPRELRTDVKPSEALELVRNKSFYDPTATGGQLAGGKAIESAVRDGVKATVSDTVPLLRDQGRAMDARSALDRGAWRDANRDQIGMGGMLGVANGRPIIGALLQLLKENQLRAGLAAGRTGRGIQQGAQRTGEELQQIIAALIAGSRQE